jgi:hypothetical protein
MHDQAYGAAAVVKSRSQCWMSDQQIGKPWYSNACGPMLAPLALMIIAIILKLSVTFF